MTREPLLDMKAVMDLWTTIQISLAAVPRWEKYQRASGNAARPQNSLQHTYALALLGDMVLARLKWVDNMNTELVMLALLVHDLGEGEIKYDTAYLDKTVINDLKEYLAFCGLIKNLNPHAQNRWKEAFLLQFALKNPKEFPDEERRVMQRLAEVHRYECMAFEAIERYDYVLYAREQFDLRQTPVLLVWTLRNQLPHLRRLVQELPGFAGIWHTEVDAWAEKFLADYADIEEEKKAV